MEKVEGGSGEKELANENHMGQRSGSGKEKTRPNAVTGKFLRSNNEKNSCFCRSFFTYTSAARCGGVLVDYPWSLE